MRMWLCDQKIMCQKHLCGEHLEMHMFIGSIIKEKSVDGYLQNNLLEPKKLKERHDELSNEMSKRNYNHKTPVIVEEFDKCMNNLHNEQLDFRNVKIDKERALKDLLKRCPECHKNHTTISAVYQPLANTRLLFQPESFG